MLIGTIKNNSISFKKFILLFYDLHNLFFIIIIEIK